MSEMVERVARAIDDAMTSSDNLALARAAIEAMREPTAEVVAGHMCLCVYRDEADRAEHEAVLREVWGNMINGALHPPAITKATTP
jgi:DNA-binding FrmR family transcriptional regulator